MKDLQLGSSIGVSQERATEKLEEIPVEKKLKEDLRCTPTMHAKYRSLLGQINGLQSMTPFQCCYKFSRCASSTASPTTGDVKSSSQAGDRSQVEASETSVQASHRTHDNNWVS